MGEHFRQVFDGAVEEVSLRHGLDYDETSLLFRLVHMANWRTGTIHGSARYLAERLGVGSKRLVRMLDALDATGVVAREHRRGHEGTVTVLGWPELVKLPADVVGSLLSRSRQSDASDQDIPTQVPNRRERPAQTQNVRIDASASAESTRAIAHIDASEGQNDASDQGIASGLQGLGVVYGVEDDDNGEAVGHALASCCVCGSTDGVREWPVPQTADVGPVVTEQGEVLAKGSSNPERWRDRWGKTVWYCPRCEPMDGQPIEGLPSWC